MHNFELSEEQEMVQETIRKLVTDDVGPKALEHDEHRTFVRHSFDQLAETGFLGLPIAEASGGAGLGMVSFVLALEELARGCSSTARLFLVHTGMCGKALEGIDAAAELVGALAGGEKLLAWIGPEAGITADDDGQGVRLAGTASLVTAATEADVFLVFAQSSDGARLCVIDAAAVRREPLAALGFRAAALGSVSVDGVAVAADGVLARDDAADAAATRAALAAQIGGAALAVGMAQASFRATRRHAHDRVAFGKPLFAQQSVRHKLELSWRNAESARHLTFHAARLVDAGQDAGPTAMLARLAAVDAAVVAADEGIQIHGGFGYTVEYHVERHYRDAKTLEVLEGGAEALRDAVAQAVAQA